MASQQHDGITNFHTYHYDGSIATEFGFFAKVIMNLDHNEYKEFKTWVATREAILAANCEAEERKKYPHAFGGMYDLCIYCGCGDGFFGRNEGKPCANRYQEEKDKKNPEVIDIKMILRKRGPIYKIMFRKMNGALLPTGKYMARIGQIVEIDNDRFNLDKAEPRENL